MKGAGRPWNYSAIITYGMESPYTQSTKKNMMKSQEDLLRELLEEVKEQRRYVETRHTNSLVIKNLVEQILGKEEEPSQ